MNIFQKHNRILIVFCYHLGYLQLSKVHRFLSSQKNMLIVDFDMFLLISIFYWFSFANVSLLVTPTPSLKSGKKMSSFFRYSYFNVISIIRLMGGVVSFYWKIVSTPFTLSCKDAKDLGTCVLNTHNATFFYNSLAFQVESQCVFCSTS